MGFIKANKQINNFFPYVSLSYKFHQPHTGDCRLRGGGCPWISFFFFFIKLKYSAQAICSPRFPFIIFPPPAFLQPGNPSSCPYHLPGLNAVSLPWAAPPARRFRVGCRASIAPDIPVKQVSTCIWSRGLWSTVIFLSPFPPCS